VNGSIPSLLVDCSRLAA